ncbi:MAG: sulfatase-like hydrolase/transferase [Saprospiraceae bacterium]
MYIKKTTLSILCCLLATFAIAQTESKSKPPNILCILVDDMGFGDLSCQGATDMRTPNIDNFAKEGMTCTNFYANCTVCSPSRASLLSGRYPDLVGVPGVIRQNEDNNWGYLAPDAILMPQVLKAKGYHSAIIGKWHLGLESPNTPTEKGFDLFKGFLGDMMDDYWNHRRGGINWMRHNQEEIDPQGHATDLFTDWAIDYLQERKDDDQPYYLYLAYNAPHFPIQPPQEWLDRVLEREKGIDEKRAKNVAFIEHLDYSIGRVLATLASTGLDENTLIVFTSDNGGALSYAQSNGKLRGGKQDMYEGGIRVPAFIKWKNHIAPGTKNSALMMHMDLYATFCAVAGVDLYHPIDGINLLPTLLDHTQSLPDRFVYWVRREGGGYGGQAYYAARYGEYKILQNTPYEPIEFFNITKDEYETKALDPSSDEVYQKLRMQLKERIRAAGQIPWQKKE